MPVPGPSEPGGPPPWVNFWLFEEAFDASECDRLVALGEEIAGDAEDGAMEDGTIEGMEDPGELRDSRIAWLGRGPETEWAFERLEALAAEANATWGLETHGIVEDLQYTMYDLEGSHYTWHHDGLESGVDDRKLSLVLQLSEAEEYRGADLEFLEVAVDYGEAELARFRSRCRRRGTVVAFCAFEYHRVTPLEGGLRRSLVAWVSGPRLR